MGKRVKMDTTRSPEVYLGAARQYLRAADAVAGLAEEASMPFYFLHAHTLELGLKAFLRLHGSSVPISGRDGHDLATLAIACYAKGLRVGAMGHGWDLVGLAGLLAYENDEHGFRYYLPKTTIRPDADNLRDVVIETMRIVSEEIAKRPSPGPRKASLFKITVKAVPIETDRDVES